MELGPAIVEVASEPAVDGLTTIVQWLVAAFFAGILAALLAVAATHGYAGWRVLSGVNWALVEGLAVVLVGGLLMATMLGLDVGGRPWLSAPLVAAAVAYVTVAGLLVASRRWFGEIRFPLHPSRGPWWLRLGGGFGWGDQGVSARSGPRERRR